MTLCISSCVFLFSFNSCFAGFFVHGTSTLLLVSVSSFLQAFFFHLYIICTSSCFYFSSLLLFPWFLFVSSLLYFFLSIAPLSSFIHKWRAGSKPSIWFTPGGSQSRAAENSVAPKQTIIPPTTQTNKQTNKLTTIQTNKQTNKQITNKQTSTYNITSNKVNKWTNTLTKTQSERWTDRNQITDRRLTHYQDQPTVTNCYSHVFSFFHHLLLSVSSIRSKDEVCLLSIYLSVLYICLFIYMLSDHLSVCSAHHILFICSICLLSIIDL